MRLNSHDPYKATGPMVVPQLNGEPPIEGPYTVLAYVDRYVPRVNAGAEWMLHHMLRSVVEGGGRALVVTRADDAWEYEGVEAHPVARAKEFAKVADVMIAHLAWTNEAIRLAYAHTLPLVYLMHNDNQVDYWHLATENVTAMVWNSVWMRDVHMPGWAAVPSIICRPPVRLRDYALDRDPWGAPYVTLVNPNPEKGATTFYEMARRRPGVRFMTVEGGYGTQLRPPVQVRNVHRQVHTGRMRDEVYARTRILCVPSSYESWGRVAAEAICSGIPVIAHPTPGLVECLGDAGTFVDRKDIDGWVDALDRLGQPHEYDDASARARTRAAELDQLADRDCAGFDQLLRRCAAMKRATVSV